MNLTVNQSHPEVPRYFVYNTVGKSMLIDLNQSVSFRTPAHLKGSNFSRLSKKSSPKRDHSVSPNFTQFELKINEI